MLLNLFIAALWSLAGKGLTSWHWFVMFNCNFVIFPCGILGQVWYFIVSIPDLCRLSYIDIKAYYPKTWTINKYNILCSDEHINGNLYTGTIYLLYK